MIRVLFLLLTASFCLTGCGIKPSSVEPPTGSEDSTYPATYPNPNTDP